MPRTVLLPMSYKIHGRLPGRVMPRSYIFAEMIEVAVTDVAPEDAPLAVSWKVPYLNTHITPSEYRSIWAYDAQQRQHTVFHDGRHWLRLLRETPWSNIPSEPVRTADFEAGAEKGAFNGTLGFPVPTQGQRQFEIVAGDPADRFEEIIRNGRSKALEQASGLEFISVSGVLHMRCDQPCFKLVPAWIIDDRTRVKTRYPVVDTQENRTPRELHSFRIPAVPLSMRDEVLRLCPEVHEGPADQFEWPAIHLPDAISADEELRLEADYLVQEFLALTQSELNAQYPGLEHYFGKPTVEAKLDYLLASEPEWHHFEVRSGISTAPLRRAVETLDGMSISLITDASRTAAPML